jgi:hypothetical protein
MVCLAMALPVLAQRGGDPLSGTWTGDWGPSPGDRNNVTLDLKLDGKAVTGTVHSTNPKRDDVTLQKSTFDSATGKVHLEAEAKNPRGGAAIHYIIDGKLANGTISGSWNHDNRTGDFKLTKK